MAGKHTSAAHDRMMAAGKLSDARAIATATRRLIQTGQCGNALDGLVRLHRIAAVLPFYKGAKGRYRGAIRTAETLADRYYRKCVIKAR